MLTTLLVVLAAMVVAPLLFLWLKGERGRILPSTRAFLRESGFKLNTLHGYIYSRWTPQYIKTLIRLPLSSSPGPSGKRAKKAAQWLADRYHGKVLTHEHATAIVRLDRKIPLQDLEQIVPFPMARNIVLSGPPDVVVYECVCRHARPTHCSPTQVCMVIGKPMTDFVLEHQPDKARRLTQAEALELLRAEHERGHVHTAWFKDAMLNRFYAICNCCKCCCAGVSAMRAGVRIMASSGYVAEIDRELCGDCGDCVTACAFEALAQDGGGVLHDWERCMGCGACEAVCKTGAITLVRDERKGIPLDIRALVHN